MPNRTAQVEIIVYKIIDDKIVFLLLKRNEQKGGFWQPITGGVNPEENLIHAVDRELQEETGVESYLEKINDVYYFEFETEKYGIIKEYVFGVKISPDTNIKISDEHTEMKWCTLDEALALLKHESNKTGFRNLFSLLS
jgi:dATP pyrophosphohydrolase